MASKFDSIITASICATVICLALILGHCTIKEIEATSAVTAHRHNPHAHEHEHESHEHPHEHPHPLPAHAHPHTHDVSVDMLSKGNIR